MLEAMREDWTDDRMDDLAKRVESGFASVDQRFAELHEDNRQLRREMMSLRTELRTDNSNLAGELRGEVAKLATELRAENAKLATELRAENAKLAGELRAENAKLAGELRAEMKALGEELRGEMKELRTGIDERFGRLERRFDYYLVTMIVGFGGLIASHFIG